MKFYYIPLLASFSLFISGCSTTSGLSPVEQRVADESKRFSEWSENFRQDAPDGGDALVEYALSQIPQENYRYIDLKVALNENLKQNCIFTKSKQTMADLLYSLEGDSTPRIVKGVYELGVDLTGRNRRGFFNVLVKSLFADGSSTLEVMTYLAANADRYDPQEFCNVFDRKIKSSKTQAKRIKWSSSGTQHKNYLNYMLQQFDKEKRPFVLYGTTSVKDGYFSFMSIFIEPPYMRLARRNGEGMRLNDISTFKAKDGFTYQLYCFVQGRWENKFDLFATYASRYGVVQLARDHYAYSDKQLAFNPEFDKDLLTPQFRPGKKDKLYFRKRIPLNQLAICHIPLHLLSKSEI